MNIPGQLAAGDSYTWQDDPTQDNLNNPITSDAWALTYYLRGPNALTLTGQATPPGWQVSITSTQSQGLQPGNYYWQAAVTNGGQRMTLGTGMIQITPNLAYGNNPAAYDGRSQSEQALDAINSEIQARLTGGMVEDYTIGNRSLKKTPMKDLIELQARYKTIVARERQAQKIAQGLGNPRAMFVRFSGNSP
jgi:hypothetical protein